MVLPIRPFIGSTPVISNPMTEIPSEMGGQNEFGIYACSIHKLLAVILPRAPRMIHVFRTVKTELRFYRQRLHLYDQEAAA